MGFTLRIFLMGLVAIARDDGSNFMVVLQQAGHQPANAALSLEKHAQHFPVLIYPCDEQDCPSFDAKKIGSLLNVDHVVGEYLVLRASSPERRNFGGILLGGEEITIASGSVNPGKIECGRRVRGKTWFGGLRRVPKSQAELSDCSWIPSMAKISRKSGVIKRSIVENPQPDMVAAILRLKGVAGSMKVFSLGDEGELGDSNIRSFKFKEHGFFERRLSKQALADIVMIEVPINGPGASLLLSDFASPDSRRSITLKPREGEDVVEVLLGNLTPLSGSALQAVQERHPVDHFKLYYALSDSNLNEVEIRYPHFGRYKVLRNAIEGPTTPDVVRVVSCGGESGGTCRPICTCTDFRLPAMKH